MHGELEPEEKVLNWGIRTEDRVPQEKSDKTLCKVVITEDNPVLE
tara:strand:- start:459 stop:593 length:135 start_codon:yes stop_codon:yes gene_type:complete